MISSHRPERYSNVQDDSFHEIKHLKDDANLKLKETDLNLLLITV